MSWLGIEGHDAIVERFRRSIAAGRLGSTFLFVGPAGVGKRTFALRLAQSLLCEQAKVRPLDPCGTCAACTQVIAGTHPDLDIIAKPADKSFIPLQLLIGEKQHRLRDGLCACIAMRPAHGGRKFGIIDDADYLNQEGANCLLKTLEEPPASSILILIGTSPQRQLPTIRSRCQIVRFQPLEHSICARLLRQLELASDESHAQQLAALCQGSLARAADWSDPGLSDFREMFRQALSNPALDSQKLAKTVADFVNAAGKEAPNASGPTAHGHGNCQPVLPGNHVRSCRCRHLQRSRK